MSTPTRPQIDRRLLADLALTQGTLDRASHLRSNDGELTALWANPTTAVIHSRGSSLAIASDGTLATTSPAEVHPDSERHLLAIIDGGAYFLARRPGADDEPPPSCTWLGLREAGPALPPHQAALAVTAVALANWHETHPRCARCGSPTDVVSAGWVRRCPGDSSEHYPRIDSAVIMLVRDHDDRALLARNAAWADGWFSTLAGFVEPGETLEAAVRREVFEETGVIVGSGDDEVVYLGSQPWPFPSSLMLGFHAVAEHTEVIVDGHEVGDARWFSREELAQACSDRVVTLPPRLSISRRLIERWYGEPLPGSWSRP